MRRSYLVVEAELITTEGRPEEPEDTETDLRKLNIVLDEQEPLVDRDFDLASPTGSTYRQIQVDQLAKIVSVSSISYPSDS